MARLRRGGWLVRPLLTAAVLLVMAALVAYRPWARPRRGEAPAGGDWTACTWEELSAWAAYLAESADEGEAVARASRLGLCAADGTLDATHAKEVTLLDGSRAQATLVGIWQDERTDGGRAGLTFALHGLPQACSMNLSFEDAEGDHADAVGGWAACEARSWLADTLWYELPGDLRAAVAGVQKRTAGSVDADAELAEAGRLAGSAADWVGETSERLWLFSAAELCGEVEAREDLGVDATMSRVYEAEGTQYRLFAQTGVEAFAPSACLARLGLPEAGDATPRTWWLRTKTLEFGDGFWLVGIDGTPLNGLGEDERAVEDPEYAPDELWGPDHARALVVGFCL